MPPIEYVVLMGRGYQRREGALISSRLLQLQVMRASVRSVGYTDGKSTLLSFDGPINVRIFMTACNARSVDVVAK